MPLQSRKSCAGIVLEVRLRMLEYSWMNGLHAGVVFQNVAVVNCKSDYRVVGIDTMMEVGHLASKTATAETRIRDSLRNETMNARDPKSSMRLTAM